MITNDNCEQAYLELALVTRNLEIMQKWVNSIPDIVHYKDFIQNNLCTTECYNYLLKIAVDSHDKVLVKHDGKALLVLKNIVRNNPTLKFNEDTSKLSFQVFRKYVLYHNAVMSSCANRLLVNVILDDDSIKWLLDNADESEHVLNRILRYLIYREFIANWAKQKYQSNALPNRTSELIGLMIKEDVPHFIDSDTKVKIWGIYYSRTCDDVKKMLLLSLYSFDIIDDFISICKRLGYFDIIEETLRAKTNIKQEVL